MHPRGISYYTALNAAGPRLSAETRVHPGGHLHAYDMALYDDIIDEDADPPKRLIIGPDGAANLLELIGAVLDNDDVLIWHAMRCRKQYLDLLPGPGGER